MTKFVKKHRSQFGRVSVVMLTIAGLVMMGGFAFMFVGTADALQLTSRSATLQDSEHSQLSQMTFVFTTGTALTTDATATADFSFVLNFPTEATTDPYGTSVPNFVGADVTATCTSCASQVMAVTDVEESDNAGQAVNDEFLIAINETGQDSNPLPAGSVVTVTFGAATGAQRITNTADNPGASAECTDGATAADADVCSITVGTSENITGATPTIVDTGDVLVAHISDVTVSVTVDESLTFSINSVTNANCDTTFGVLAGPDSTSNAVDFGTISTFNTFIHACQDLAVVTNASNGYTVTTETDTSLQSSGGVEIDSGTCSGASCDSTTEGAWGTNTDNGFAYSCSTLTNDDGGNACNLTTEITNYKRFPCVGIAADCSPGNSEAVHTVLADVDTGNDSARVEYKLSISNTQAAAVYSTQVTYIATPTF